MWLLFLIRLCPWEFRGLSQTEKSPWSHVMSSSRPPYSAWNSFCMFQEKIGTSSISYKKLSFDSLHITWFAGEQFSEVVLKLIKGKNLRKTWLRKQSLFLHGVVAYRKDQQPSFVVWETLWTKRASKLVSKLIEKDTHHPLNKLWSPS